MAIEAQFIRQLEGIEMVRPGERPSMHWTRLTSNFYITINPCCHLGSEKYQLIGLWLAFILSTKLSGTRQGSCILRQCLKGGVPMLWKMGITRSSVFLSSDDC